MDRKALHRDGHDPNQPNIRLKEAAWGREARLSPTAESAPKGRSPRPHYAPPRGPAPTCGRSPGARSPALRLLQHRPGSGSSPLGRRRRGLRSGGGSCSPSRQRRCCRGRRARIWREPQRPLQPARRLDKMASREVPPREMRSAGSILARSGASIPPIAPLLIFPRRSGLSLGGPWEEGGLRLGVGGVKLRVRHCDWLSAWDWSIGGGRSKDLTS